MSKWNQGDGDGDGTHTRGQHAIQKKIITFYTYDKSWEVKTTSLETKTRNIQPRQIKIKKKKKPAANPVPLNRRVGEKILGISASKFRYTAWEH